MTTYLAPHGKGLAFEGKEGLKFKEITDGASRTILLVEVNPEQAVIWTKPQDLEVDINKPMRGLGNAHDKGFATLFCDGSARFFPKTIELKILRHFFTRNGGEVP